MGANAQTSVPTFTLGQVLTAAQMNESARTGVPVFAGTTERDAAFGGTGEKTLAEGQLCYLESTNVVQYYDGSNWATVGPSSASGLTLISATTVGSGVASVTISNAFSATYDNYRVLISTVDAAAGNDVDLTFGATATGYYGFLENFNATAGTTNIEYFNNTTAFTLAYAGTNDDTTVTMDILAPNLAKRTVWTAMWNGSNFNGMSVGQLQNTTQYTAFTLTAVGTTFTGGTIRVYGYTN